MDLGIDGIFTDEILQMADKFPEQLLDAGRAISDPPQWEENWQGNVPPMP
jgi:hypothetical protein